MACELPLKLDGRPSLLQGIQHIVYIIQLYSIHMLYIYLSQSNMSFSHNIKYSHRPTTNDARTWLVIPGKRRCIAIMNRFIPWISQWKVQEVMIESPCRRTQWNRGKKKLQSQVLSIKRFIPAIYQNQNRTYTYKQNLHGFCPIQKKNLPKVPGMVLCEGCGWPETELVWRCHGVSRHQTKQNTHRQEGK